MILSAEELVRLEGVNLDYGKKGESKILQGVCLYLRKGEIVGLQGDSGSGKTTLAYLLCGLKKSALGKISCPSGKVGMVLQNPETSFDPIKSVGWTLAETRLEYLRAKGLPLPKKRSLEEELRLRSEEFGIAGGRLRNCPSKFSGGELQRLSILRVLLRESDILILDEATSMLDLLMQAKILRFLLDIQKKYSLTYLVISHDRELIRSICHRVYFIEKGRVREGEIEKC